MADIPGVRIDITGASGTQGLLAPMPNWRLYVFPRGGYASQASSGATITFDTAAVASRFAVNNWIQSGLSTANIRQVSGVGGNSITVSGSNLTVSKGDRIFVIGNTQPTINGSSATYLTPASFIYQRDDDTSDLYTNSMLTSDSNGTVQPFAQVGIYDALIQDSNQSNQGSIVDLTFGAQGVSTSSWSVFGSTVTFNANIGVTGSALFGATVTINGALGTTGWATFGSTVTMNAQLGVSGTATFGTTTIYSGWATFGATATFNGAVGITGTLAVAQVIGGLSVTTGVFGVSQQPRVRAYGTSAITSVAGTSTAIPWDSESFGVGGLHAAGATSSRITAAMTGVYHFSTNLLYSGISTGGGGPTKSVSLRKNGAAPVAVFWQQASGVTTSDHLCAIDYAVAGDYYEVVLLLYGAAGAAAQLTATSQSSYFSAVKVC